MYLLSQKIIQIVKRQVLNEKQSGILSEGHFIEDRKLKNSVLSV